MVWKFFVHFTLAIDPNTWGAFDNFRSFTRMGAENHLYMCLYIHCITSNRVQYSFLVYTLAVVLNWNHFQRNVKCVSCLKKIICTVHKHPANTPNIATPSSDKNHIMCSRMLRRSRMREAIFARLSATRELFDRRAATWYGSLGTHARCRCWRWKPHCLHMRAVILEWKSFNCYSWFMVARCARIDCVRWKKSTQIRDV